MGWFFLVLLVAACVLSYYYLAAMETEIRAEIGAAESPAEPETTEAGARAARPDVPLETLICRCVGQSPEMLQTELYHQFPGTDKKLIQKRVLELVHSGKLLRVRSGNTYKLTLMD